MPKQSIKTEVINPCFVQTYKPASLACSIQFSFFLSAWFFVTQKTDQSRSHLLRLRADSFEEISLILPSHTVKERKTRGQKSRSDYQSLERAFLLSTVSDKVAINWRVSHVPGSSPRRGKTTYFRKNVNDFRHLFFDYFQKSSETLYYQWFFS